MIPSRLFPHIADTTRRRVFIIINVAFIVACRRRHLTSKRVPCIVSRHNINFYRSVPLASSSPFVACTIVPLRDLRMCGRIRIRRHDPIKRPVKVVPTPVNVVCVGTTPTTGHSIRSRRASNGETERARRQELMLCGGTKAGGEIPKGAKARVDGATATSIITKTRRRITVSAIFANKRDG